MAGWHFLVLSLWKSIGDGFTGKAESARVARART